jgi:tetratricopeptide (TPR) repeat protein
MMNQSQSAPTARQNELKEQYEAQRRSERAGAFVLAARRALQKGDREEAKAQLKQAFTTNPGDEKAVDVLGDVYLEEGETEKALELFEKALRHYPHNTAFQEKAAICRLDLAEMEADKNVVPLLVDVGDKSKIFERSPHKAVSLSVFLPGAGQFYNEENEKGAAFVGAYLVSTLCWFYPLWTQMSNQKGTARLDYGLAMSNLSGLGALAFKVGVLVSFIVYVASLYDAGKAAAKWNLERRKALGLEK